MKVLLFDTTQAYLTPGGKQVHAQKLYENLPQVGVEVDYAKWWDPTQTFDIIHFFGYNAHYLLGQIKHLKKKTVLTQVLDVQTNSSPKQKFISSKIVRLINLLPDRFKNKFDTASLNRYDALVYIHKYDRQTALEVLNVDERKTTIIPHASDPIEIIESSEKFEGLPPKYLVSTGTIVDRKRPILLAQLAKKAKVPVVFIGPGNENEAYFKEFSSLVDNKYVFYLGFISQKEKIKVLSNSSGFALLSKAESGCIAVYEAASLGLPLLLPDLLWAKCYTDPKEIYHCNCENVEIAAKQLLEFFSKAERKNYQSFKVYTWQDIAGMYKEVYEKVLANS